MFLIVLIYFRIRDSSGKIHFNIQTKWNEQEYEEMLYYCDHDVDALFPIFDILMTRFKSKFIIAKLGKMDPEYALSLTDANLTAKLLGGEKQEHTDNFTYVYPEQVEKEKIPKEALDYSKKMAENQDGKVLVHNSKGANKGRIKKK